MSLKEWTNTNIFIIPSLTVVAPIANAMKLVKVVMEMVTPACFMVRPKRSSSGRAPPGPESTFRKDCVVTNMLSIPEWNQRVVGDWESTIANYSRYHQLIYQILWLFTVCPCTKPVIVSVFDIIFVSYHILPNPTSRNGIKLCRGPNGNPMLAVRL